jgi:hypothetical protein
MEARPVIPRKRIKHQLSLGERLMRAARQNREAARTMQPGRMRELLLRRARQNETAANIDKWLSSPGLQPPR